MTVEITTSNQDVIKIVENAIQHHGNVQEELIPILSDVNRSIGYLPTEALEEISIRMKLPKSHVLSVASFYHMLSTKPRGRHVIKMCESAPCHVVGRREVLRALQNELDVKQDETTPDGKWTFITTSCLGLCGVGPVIVIDDDIYGNVKPEQVSEILSHYE